MLGVLCTVLLSCAPRVSCMQHTRPGPARLPTCSRQVASRRANFRKAPRGAPTCTTGSLGSGARARARECANARTWHRFAKCSLRLSPSDRAHRFRAFLTRATSHGTRTRVLERLAFLRRRVRRDVVGLQTHFSFFLILVERLDFVLV